MLYKTYKRAMRAGGEAMPVAKYAKVFGNDTALRRNVLRACAYDPYGQAIADGVVADHRVFESLSRMGERAAAIALEVETRLGRKLGRARAQLLAGAYLRVRARRLASQRANTVVHFQRRPTQSGLAPDRLDHSLERLRRAMR